MLTSLKLDKMTADFRQKLENLYDNSNEIVLYISKAKGDITEDNEMDLPSDPV